MDLFICMSVELCSVRVDESLGIEVNKSRVVIRMASSMGSYSLVI